MADEPHFDEHGRGPLQREFHRRCGFDPMGAAPGFASFARALDRARASGNEFPEQFREVLAAAVAAVVGPVLEAERARVRADVEVVVGALVEERLAKVRAAYAALLARVDRLEAALRPAPNRAVGARR